MDKIQIKEKRNPADRWREKRKSVMDRWNSVDQTSTNRCNPPYGARMNSARATTGNGCFKCSQMDHMLRNVLKKQLIYEKTEGL